MRFTNRKSGTMRKGHIWLIVALGGLVGCSTVTGAPPKGSEDAPGEDEVRAMKAVGGKANGVIVWSSSRDGNHDLFTMKTDGSDVKAITHGEDVDWFPRFSPDGVEDSVLSQQERLGQRARRQQQ